MIPKTSAYVKIMMEKLIGSIFFIKDDELLETYDDIFNRVRNSIKKELECEPICNKHFLKTKIRSYSDETTDFNVKEVPKVGPNYTCLAVILLDVVLKKAIIRKCFQGGL